MPNLFWQMDPTSPEQSNPESCTIFLVKSWIPRTPFEILVEGVQRLGFNYNFTFQMIVYYLILISTFELIHCLQQLQLVVPSPPLQALHFLHHDEHAQHCPCFAHANYNNIKICLENGDGISLHIKVYIPLISRV